MSSLAKQLAVIAASSTHELDLNAQKSAHSKSLLFDPKIAASQSFDTLYHICYEGFHELCSLDNRFLRYQKSIFSAQSVTEDREHMKKSENDELDVVLEAFLGLVGARLLLKPALKAVEWLVRRFRIHEHNISATIITFLPYHATHLFPALLALLPAQLPSTYKFLHPYIGSLSSPPRSLLLYTTIHTPSFFAAINRYVLTTAKAHAQHQALLSFWASLVVQTVDGKINADRSGRHNVQNQREEDFLLQLLPVINEAMAIRNAPDMTLASYMIIVVLVAKANLADNVLDALMKSVVMTWSSSTIDPGLACLAAIAERRQSTQTPQRVIKAILKLDSISERLLLLAKNQSIASLASSLASSIAQQDQVSETSVALVNDFFTNNLLATRERETLKKYAVANHLDTLFLRLSASSEAENADDHVNMLENGAAESKLEISALDAGNKKVEETFVNISTTTIEVSLLASALSPLFNSIAAAFAPVVASDHALKTFRSLPIWRQGRDVQSILLVTFLVRSWCTSPSISVRCAALRIAGDELGSAGANGSDFQALVPYILLALTDPSRKVRKSAMKLTMKVQQLMKAETAETTWAKDTFYGEIGSNMSWMSSKTFSCFLDGYLVPDLDECVSDANHILRTFRKAMSGSPGEDLEEQCRKSSQRLEVEKRFKSHHRIEVYICFAAHLQITPLLSAKLGFLSLLNSVEKVGGEYRSRFLLPCLREYVLTGSNQSISSVSELDVSYVRTVHGRDPEALRYLLDLSQRRIPSAGPLIHEAAFSQLQNIWPFIKSGGKRSIAESLLDSICTPGLENALSRAGSDALLRNVNLPADLLFNLFTDLLGSWNTAEQSPSKRRRNNNGSHVEISSSESSKALFARTTYLLELTDSANPESHIGLFHNLFAVLRVLQDQHSRDSSDMSYLRTLTLGCLSTLARKIDKTVKAPLLDTSIVRVDLLVDCIRDTPNIEGQNAALILLIILSKHFPQTVLHNIIPIFTMISTSTVRQSDDFSVYIVDQTVKEVIPLLAESLREQNKNLVSATAEILLSFAAAFDHVSPTRRLTLFELLASSLGPSESLYAIVATVHDRVENISEATRFSSNLLRRFKLMDSLTTISKYLALLLEYFATKQSQYTTLIKQDSVEAQRIFRVIKLASAVPHLIIEGIENSSLQVVLRKDTTEAENHRALIGEILEHTIQLSHNLESANQPLEVCSQIVRSMLKQLPYIEVVKVVEPLLNPKDPELCKSLLKSLESETHRSGSQRKSTTAVVLKPLPKLLHMLKEDGDPILKPNAIACIDKLIEKFGKLDTVATTEVANVIAGPQCLGGGDKVLQTLSLHCLSSVVEMLGNDFIPVLERSIEGACKCLNDSLSDATFPKLHSAALAFVITVVSNIPYMLKEEHLLNILSLCQLSAELVTDIQVTENRLHLMQIISSKLDITLVASVCVQVWHSAVNSGRVVSRIHHVGLVDTNIFQAVQEHITLLEACVAYRTKSDITSNALSLFQAFSKILDVRRCILGAHTSNTRILEQAKEIEDQAIRSLIALVLKVNDAIFRPFFVQLVQWSAEDQSHGSARSLAFFSFIYALSQQLESLITPYFSHVTEIAEAILQQDSETSQELKSVVLKALASGFHHDQDDFWASPSRFANMLPSLVAQLHRPQHLPTTRTIAIPAITAFASANASSPEHLKTLNASLLATMRSEQAISRQAAVLCQQSITKELGEEWLSLLPEMLPTIAELQEDDDERVEKETARWIKMMEEVLGESLEGMLQ